LTLTRRHLLVSAGAAAAAALPVRSALGASVPPPLPAPLGAEVFRARQSRLKAEAKARGFDALFVTPSTNLAYAANLAIGRSERLTALILRVDGPAVLVTPSFEEANHRRDAVVDDVKTWAEDENPIALAARTLAGCKTIGIEGTTAFSTAAELKDATAETSRDATAVFEALRMIKSPEEQAFLKDAGRRTNAAIEATHARLRAGMTEREVGRILEEEFTRQLVRGGGLVQFGPSSAFPHGAPAERRLARGDVVLIDAGCRVRGYTSDITRSVVFGAPSDEARKVYGVVDRAQSAGIDALVRGRTGEEVDRAARKVIEDAGYGAYFTHRLGHGLGMDGHESPYLVRGNRSPIVEGNVFTVEPGIYLPGKFGVRIEDDYAVGAKGPVSLSVRPMELVTIPS
jgi:Xaa-Pro dipeptidase